MKIAVIPARGGSKRIPKKNIRDFSGKPIIAWSIEAALLTGRFDRVIVSTDDPDIAEVAIAHGAEVPFLRPSDLADDVTPTIPVVRHAISWLRESNVDVSEACCIYATAPFVQPMDILEAHDLLSTSSFSFVVPVVSFGFPIQRALRIHDGKSAEMLDPSKYASRSQDLEECFHDVGQFYWGTVDAWLQHETVFGGNSGVVVLPRYRVQDIDTLEDWKRAEYMFKAIRDSADESPHT